MVGIAAGDRDVTRFVQGRVHVFKAGAFDQPHRLAKLAVLVEQALSSHLRLSQKILKLT